MKIIQQWSAFRTAERQWDDVHEGQLVEVHFTEGPVVIGVRENKSYILGNICDSCIFFVAHIGTVTTCSKTDCDCCVLKGVPCEYFVPTDCAMETDR